MESLSPSYAQTIFDNPLFAFPHVTIRLTYHRSTSHVIASLLGFAVDGVSEMHYFMSPKRPEVTKSLE